MPGMGTGTVMVIRTADRGVPLGICRARAEATVSVRHSGAPKANPEPVSLIGTGDAPRFRICATLRPE